MHEDNSYGYADDLMEIKQIIYKYIDEYIYEYENKIKIVITPFLIKNTHFKSSMV